MTQAIINVGPAPNDGLGDPIRTAFIKSNDNFNELYARAANSVPTTFIGSAGDQYGDYASDSNFFYFCYGTYDGVSNIWNKAPALGSITSLDNGTSNVSIPVAGGNATITIGGVNNVGIFTPTGLILPTGSITTGGAATFSGVLTTGSSASIGGNLTAPNLTTAGTTDTGILITSGIATIGGNLTAPNLITPGDTNTGTLTTSGNATIGSGATVTGNLTAANLDTGIITATGNITAPNLTTPGTTTTGVLVVTGNATVGNLNTAGEVNATGNITTAGIFFGNGSGLTGVSASQTNYAVTFNDVGNGSASGSSFNGGAVLTVSYNTVGAPSIAGNNAIGTWNINVSGVTVNASSSVNTPTLSATNANLTGNVNFTNMSIADNVISSISSDIYIDPAQDSASLGTVYILGNLQVSGNLTTVNAVSVTTDSLVFESANNAINSAAASGGGLAVGPSGSAYATWLFNSITNSWNSNIGIYAPSFNGGTFTGDGSALTGLAGALTGTTNQVLVNGGVGPVTGNTTLTLPQSINTTANVQFGSFGVGTAASGTVGEIRATNNVTAFYASDKRFKENVNSIINALNIVNDIGGKTFDWTDSYVQDHGGADGYFITKSDFGVVAQDVQRVFPLAVRVRNDGSLAVDYAKLSALAFAAINEMNNKFSNDIAELRAEIAKLKGE